MVVGMVFSELDSCGVGASDLVTALVWSEPAEIPDALGVGRDDRVPSLEEDE